MNRLICLVGMGGAGKSEVADYLMTKKNFGYVRFGQITLDKIKNLGKKPSEALEKEIRENLRKEFGMAAFAKLNIPKFDMFLKKGDVIGDGLYSWEEYLVLKEKYKEQLVVICVFSPPKLRYERMGNRADKHGEDKDLRFRNFSKEEAEKRDKAEIENLHKAGPIAMADYTIVNISSIKVLREQIDNILRNIYGE